MIKKTSFVLSALFCFLISGNIFSQDVSFYVNGSTYFTCKNAEVTFENFSDSQSNYFVWKFDDGDSLITTDPSGQVKHVYKKNGEFRPQLFGYYKDVNSNQLKLNGSFKSNYAIYVGPSINLSNDSVCPNSTVIFNQYSGNLTNIWNFGNGFTQTNTLKANTKYTEVGTYTITLVFDNHECFQGAKDTTSRKIVVTSNLIPNSNFSVSSGEICPNQPFTASAHSDSELTYLWDMGDGKTYTKNYVSHSYPNLSTNTITLTVTNTCGNSSKTSHEVNVTEKKVFGDFVMVTASNLYGICKGEEVFFNYYANYNSVASMAWKYKDQIIATKNGMSYVFDEVGEHTIQAVLTNYCGIDTIINTKIYVKSNLSFTVDPLSDREACPGSKVKVNYSNNMFGTSIKEMYWILPSNQKYYNKELILTDLPVGTYPIQLNLKNYCGNDTTLSANIYVKEDLPVVADVFTNANSYCIGEEINVFVTTDNNNTKSVVFSQEGLLESNKERATYVFNQAGLYTIQTTITNYCNKDTTIYTNVSVLADNKITSANITHYQSTYCVGEAAYFYPSLGSSSNSIYKQEYDYGDGSKGISNSHVFSKVGSYTVSLKLTNYCGNYITVNTIVDVVNDGKISPDNFDIKSDKLKACIGENVNFNLEGWASKVKSIEWIFNDGSPSMLSNETYESISHAFKQAGTYTVNAKLTGSCGDTLILSKSIEIRTDVSLNSSKVEISVPNEVCPNEQISFSIDDSQLSSNYTSNYKSYLWDFGNNLTSDLANPEHSFSTAGLKTISVKLTNNCNNELTIYKTINVNNSVQPNFYFDVMTPQVCLNDNAAFYLESEGQNNYQINFGDGSNQYKNINVIGGQDEYVNLIYHPFTSIGTKTIEVTATNVCGNSVKETVKVEVNAIGNDITTAEIYNLSAEFESSSDTTMFFVDVAAKEFEWNFGDGKIVKTDIGFVKYKFSSPGIKNISVFIKDGCGDTTTLFLETNVTNGSTGIAELETSNLLVYPNPTNNLIHVEFDKMTNPYAIITNVFGAKVWEKDNFESKNTIDVSHLPSGLYFINLSDNNSKKLVSKFIIK